MEHLLFKVAMAAIGGGVIALVYFAGVWLFGLLKGATLGKERDDLPNSQRLASAQPRPIVAPSDDLPSLRSSHVLPHRHSVGSSGSSEVTALSSSVTASVSAGVEADAIYAIVATEMDSGKMDKGLWTRLYAENDGDERKTKVAYIKQRASRLASSLS